MQNIFVNLLIIITYKSIKSLTNKPNEPQNIEIPQMNIPLKTQ